MPKRRAGSVRFDPYYKLQWWDARSMAWRDVQRSYPTEAGARGDVTADREWRVMRVDEDGREPVDY